MKIYYIVQNEECHYDEYDSCVVVADNEDQAVETDKEECENFKNMELTILKVGEYTGEAGTPSHVLLASFNAG